MEYDEKERERESWVKQVNRARLRYFLLTRLGSASEFYLLSSMQ